MPLAKKTLTLRGHYAGKTIKLGDIQFTNGKVTICGPEPEVKNLSMYLRKCFQAVPEGETCEMEDTKNGSSTVHQDSGNGPSEDVQSPVQPVGAGSSEKATDDGKGAAETETPGARDHSGGGGLTDSRLNEKDQGKDHQAGPTVDSKPEGWEEPVDPLPAPVGFEGTAHSTLDPEKILKAMQMLDPDNPDQWTMPGKPRVDAVEKLCGSAGLTRRDLDAVWPELVRVPAA